jgi:uncharacterized protein
MTSGGPELVPVRVQPRATRDEILGWRDGVLRLRVSAPPVEGEANRAVGALLARALGVRASAVTVERGARGRDKLVRVQGMTRRMVMARLAAVLLAVGIVAAGPACALAEHNVASGSIAESTPWDVALQLRVGRDGVHLGGWLVGPDGPFGAGLTARPRPHGFALDGRVQEPGRPPHGFTLDFGLTPDAAMRF